MRVLVDCSRVNTGGAIQNALSVIVNSLRTPQHEWIYVVSERLEHEFGAIKDLSDNNVYRLHSDSTIWSQIKDAYLGLKAIERKTSPDVVFTVCGPSLWHSCVRHVEGFAVPHLIYPEMISHLDIDSLERFKLELMLQWTKLRIQPDKHFVVQTRTVKRRVMELLGVKEENIAVVRNAVSPIFWDKISEKGLATDGHGRNRIFVPSAYYYHKNLEIIPMIASLLKKYTKSDFEIVLTIPPKHYGWRRIAKMAKQLGVESSIITIGELDHSRIASEYRKSRIVFLPTLLECSTAVYPESFAAEVPVVTSDLDFAHELCGNAACFFNPLSSEMAAEVLARLLQDDSFCKELIQKGKRVLASNYPSPEDKWRAQLAALENR